MKHLFIMLFMFLLPFISLEQSGTVFAQTDTSPVFFRAEQILYRWDGETVRVVAPLPTLSWMARQSPTAEYMVYMLQSDAYAEEIARECPCGGLVMPTDLYLIDLNSGETRLIAGQQEGATLATSTVNSIPVWSPDGTQLAWVRGTDGADLLVYDIASQTTRVVLSDIPSQTFVPSPIQLSAWTQSAIMMLSPIEDLDTPGYPRYRFYSPQDGRLLSESPSLSAAPLDSFVLFDTTQERDKYAIHMLDGWLLFDIQTGETEILTGGMIYGYSHPQTSLRIGSRLLDENGFSHWEANAANGSTSLIPASFQVFLVMGGTTAIVERIGAKVWFWSMERGQYIETLPIEPEVIYTDSINYALVRDAGDIVRFGTQCIGGEMPVRLTMGVGWVSGETASIIYQEANHTSQQVGEIPAGGWFYPVRSEPSCRDGIAWWQVESQGMIGWTPETIGTHYQLSPGCPPQSCV